MINSFSSGRTQIDLGPEIVTRLTGIYEFKGREKLYQAQAPEILAALQSNATIESTESSNRIEGIVASPERVRDIVSRGATPLTRSEAEIAGYRDVLGQIHASHPHIPVTANVILQLHRDMFKYTSAPAGRWKPVENEIKATMPDGAKETVFVPVSVIETPSAIETLCTDFQHLVLARRVDPLISAAAFILDFLCIHPFLDGNGRLARLLTTLLLYQSGFSVPRYVGIERLVERTKPSYYSSLRASSEGWHHGEHTVLPWLDYFLGIVLAAYEELDQKLGGGALPSKTDRVRLAIELLPQVFSKAELSRLCPDISPSTLRRVLEQLTREGKLQSQRGKAAVWSKN